MVKRYKIHCKVHDDQQRVIKVGIGNEKYPVPKVWDWIKSGDYEFYTEDTNNTQAMVKVGTSSQGRKFLTTSPDSSIDNNLDELSGCN